MGTRGHYSVLQYVPDESRSEAANVGVALFIPSQQTLSLQISPTLGRVRRFFRAGPAEMKRIASSLESLHQRFSKAGNEFRSEEDFKQFVDARADAVRLTAPRLVMVSDAATELDRLYFRLVGEHETAQAAERPAFVAMPQFLAATFGRLQASGRVWTPAPINVPMMKNKRIDVAAAFRNGHVNYVLPESLAGRGAQDRLCKVGFEGKLIADHGVDQQDSRLIVLSADPRARLDSEERWAGIFRDFKVRLVPHAALQDFATEVEQGAH